MRTLLWFRGKDLRLHDHAALRAACAHSRELLPVFVLSPAYFASGKPQRAPHRMQFLLQALRALEEALTARGSRLLCVRGPATQAIPQLAAAARVDCVMALSSVEPAARARDRRVAARLGVELQLFEGETLLSPGSVRTHSGGVYRVYTPFARAAHQRLGELDVSGLPARLPPLPRGVRLPGVTLPALDALGLQRNPGLQIGGEPAARARLQAFLHGPAHRYARLRDRLDLPGTSRLSADLHFGTLSVREIWQRAGRALARLAPDALQRYRAELLWREFAHHLLYEQPALLREPFRPEFRSFPWRDDAVGFEAWWRGLTGYPVVDAAARQLLQEGFVHNRARMISASFLTKDLLIDYRAGEAHYLRLLTDGDPAQNNLGWQWTAGCGCDAQPYFRVFNPTSQAQRFDPDGAYVRKYVPELERLPARHIHAPWLAPGSVLRDAGVVLGQTYPHPIVDHDTARRRFLLVAAEHLKFGAAQARVPSRVRGR